MSEMTIEPAALEGVRRAAQGEFTVETGVTWRGEPYVRVVAGPLGRGVPRPRWLIIAGGNAERPSTLADAFRALADCLERIAGSKDPASDG